uniref:Putative copialike retrotransposon Hopscotch polyprotein n=1 Tax=Albugo laibachii Nc14 TaxID=890382 RepID=F0WXK4_9STRA|nr:putative copialike retrotransposon Hopscotch polyprotein [Albugo laibachii Nc14]|eukprot:CCA26198.1 putative copialike retrotransposon Hopscotch polyprotein [Albugo laibachii Nc14]
MDICGPFKSLNRESRVRQRISGHARAGFSLDQKRSMFDVIWEMGFNQSHPVLKPIGHDYSDTMISNLDKMAMHSAKERTTKKLQSLAGSLLWFAQCTRLDISFAVHKLTRRTHSPTTAKWALGIRVVKYLEETKYLEFYLVGEVCTLSQEITLEAFSDADYSVDDKARKIVSGSALLLNGMLISWS